MDTARHTFCTAETAPALTLHELADAMKSYLTEIEGKVQLSRLSTVLAPTTESVHSICQASESDFNAF